MKPCETLFDEILLINHDDATKGKEWADNQARPLSPKGVVQADGRQSVRALVSEDHDCVFVSSNALRALGTLMRLLGNNQTATVHVTPELFPTAYPDLQVLFKSGLKHSPLQAYKDEDEETVRKTAETALTALVNFLEQAEGTNAKRLVVSGHDVLNRCMALALCEHLGLDTQELVNLDGIKGEAYLVSQDRFTHLS